MSPTFMNRLGFNLQRQFARVLQGLQMNAQTIVQHYDSAAAPGFDRNERTTYPDPVAAQRSFNALVHFVSDAAKAYGPQEFEVGDAVLFFDPAQDVSGEAVWFDIQGVAYVQKECGTFLARDWSLEIGGRLIHRAMLLCRRPGES